MPSENQPAAEWKEYPEPEFPNDGVRDAYRRALAKIIAAGRKRWGKACNSFLLNDARIFLHASFWQLHASICQLHASFAQLHASICQLHAPFPQLHASIRRLHASFR